MNHLIIGTAGHVDHGKTSLIKALTGFDCDTHKEEKERGITINPGFSHLDLPNGESIGIVDVPGHKDFIKNMVAGAHGIDIVVLVVAADSGIMPQTTEHVKIIEMLGVEKGIIALTKIDMVDEETLELAKLEIMEFLEGSKLEDAPIVSVSSVTGSGIEDLVSEITKVVENTEKKERSESFRLYVDRLFNVKGIGFVVTGTVINGAIQSGKDVYLLPGKGKKLRVKGIERHGNAVDKVFNGDRAAINLSGIKQGDFERGMILSGKEVDSTSMIDAGITLFENNISLGVWSNVIFYAGTFECMARMHLLDKDEIGDNESAIVQIHLEYPAILFNQDKFIIRNSSNDISLGGGTVLDVNPLHHKKRTEKLVNELQALKNASLSNAGVLDLAFIKLRKENKPMLLDDLSGSIERSTEEILEEIDHSERDNIRQYTADIGEILIDSQLDDEYKEKIIAELESWHKKYPVFRHGMDQKAFTGKFGFTANQAGQKFVYALLEKIRSEGLIKKYNDTWILSDHKVNIDKKMQDQIDWVEDEVSSFGMEKPMYPDLEAAALANGISGDKLKMILIHLSQQAKLYYNQSDVIHNNILDKCRKTLLNDIKDREKGINEKEFRELINGTKKLVQLLLTIFINEGVIKKDTFYIHITDLGKKTIN